MADGQFGTFDPSTYHFSNEDLTQIINKTQDAVNEMYTVNSTVLAHTDSLVDANRSDSGTILSGHLNTWSTDFSKCVNSLQDLNTKATNLRQVNINTDSTSTGQSH